MSPDQPFAPASLTDAVHQLLVSHPDVQPGHRGALIAAVNEHGAQFDVQAKLSDSGNWVLDGGVDYAWHGDLGASVSLKGVW